MKTSVVAGTGAMLSQPFLAADPAGKPSSFRPPLFAFCIDTHDSQKRTLPQQAELLKDLGYDGVGHLWLEHVAERLQTLDAIGLKLFQVYVRASLEPDKPPYDPKLKEVLPLLKGRGTSLALIMSGAKPSDATQDARGAQIVGEIAELAQGVGVRVVLYPHRGDWIERVEDAVRVARKTDRPNVGVMFNLCHWLAVDDEKNLVPLLQSAKPYLHAVSLHGADKAAEVQAGTGNWIQPLGSGSFDVLGLLRALRDLGYAGPIGLQCYGLTGDAKEHLARSMTAWRRFMQQLNAA